MSVLRRERSAHTGSIHEIVAYVHILPSHIVMKHVAASLPSYPTYDRQFTSLAEGTAVRTRTAWTTTQQQHRQHRYTYRAHVSTRVRMRRISLSRHIHLMSTICCVSCLMRGRLSPWSQPLFVNSICLDSPEMKRKTDLVHTEHVAVKCRQSLLVHTHEQMWVRVLIDCIFQAVITQMLMHNVS